MGLYLCIFEGDEEIDGVEIGSYADFDRFRGSVIRELERERPGSRFPTLIFHSDCDGEWSPSDAEILEKELAQIGEELRQRPPIDIPADWQRQLVKQFGLKTDNLYDCFFDVDGEPLIERLIGLARRSQKLGLPILFQ